MTKQTTPSDDRDQERLIQPTAAEHQEVMHRWRLSQSGMDGERGGLPERPDNPVAYKLLDAAGEAMARSEWQKGITILRLVVKDYRHSQEAACARTIIDRLANRHR